MQARSKSEVPDLRDFVYEQAAKQLGCEVTDIGDITMIRGGVLRNIIAELEKEIGLLDSKTLLRLFRLDRNYTVEKCVEIVRKALMASKKISV